MCGIAAQDIHQVHKAIEVINLLPGINVPLTRCDIATLFCDVCPGESGDGGGTIAVFEEVSKMSVWFDENLLGKPIDDEHLKLFADEFVRQAVPLELNRLPKDFEAVPLKPTKETISALVKYNPFFSSAVEVVYTTEGKVKGRFISALPRDGDECESKGSSFRQCIACLELATSRFRLTLNDDLAVESITVYRWSKYDRVWEEYDTDEDDKISIVTFAMTFYCEAWHVAIHFFHFIMVAALYDACKDNQKVKDFAKIYEPDLVEKVAEVYAVLIDKNGLLVSEAWRSDENSFHEFLSDALRTLGHFSSAQDFVTKFLLAPTAENKAWSHDWLPQFQEQSALIKHFADDVGQHMRSEKAYAVDTLDKKLSTYLTSVGEDVMTVQSIEQWIEIMSVTGLMHGCTLSASRVLFSKAFLYPAFPDSKTFDTSVKKLMMTVFGTTVGLSLDHAVFSHDGLHADVGLKSIINWYTEKSAGLKSAYMDSVLKNGGEESKKLGWLLSDYFPDFVDNKQLTIAAYI